MIWIDKNERMPVPHEEDEERSIYVLVTNGKNWGYGSYSYDMEYWDYYLVGDAETSGNKITHWAEPPVLPNVDPWEIMKSYNVIK